MIRLIGILIIVIGFVGKYNLMAASFGILGGKK